MVNIINIAQIVVSVFLITFILLQQKGTALGSAFGGEGGSFYSTRRGIEKKIYWATIICAILFLLLAVINLII
jgi:preprotein translocase subunit SecG